MRASDVRWVAFLRAINVGGHRVTGDQLSEVFTSIGHRDVSTFLASGNVLFSADQPEPQPIEAALLAAFGYEVPVILRSKMAISGIADADPFTEAELTPTSANVQVLLTRSQADSSSINGMDHPDEDLLRFHSGEVFWLPRAGISDSKLNVKSLERNLGALTIRTIRTIERLSARL